MDYLETKFWQRRSVGLGDVDWDDVRNRVDLICERTGFISGQKVLDVACGRGLEIIGLANRGAQAVGIDICEESVKAAQQLAKQKNVEVSILCKDMRAISWENEFDICMIRDVIFGIFDHAANMDVLKRMVRSLKGGGRLYLEVYNKSYALENGVENALFYNQMLNRFEGSFLRIKGERRIKVEASIELMSVDEWFGVLRKLGIGQIEITDSTDGSVIDKSRILLISGCKNCE